MIRALRSFGDFVAGLAFGAALGYFAAVLLAPYEGTASRGLLMDESDALRRKPRETVDQLQARIQFAMEEGRRAAAETRAELEQGVYEPGPDDGPAGDPDDGSADGVAGGPDDDSADGPAGSSSDISVA